jgi:hypothetical protein
LNVDKAFSPLIIDSGPQFAGVVCLQKLIFLSSIVSILKIFSSGRELLCSFIDGTHCSSIGGTHLFIIRICEISGLIKGQRKFSLRVLAVRLIVFLNTLIRGL